MRYVVQKENIISNLNKMRAHCPTAEVVGVIKGNGYGLGLIPMAKLLCENGVQTLAVSRLDEAVSLRENGINTAILLLSPPFDSESAKTCADLDITATVDSLATAKLLNGAAADKKAKAHIMLDTGFARFGFMPGEESDIIAALTACENVSFEGIYSHFYNAFSSDSSSVKLQVSRFNTAVAAVEAAGFKGLKKHICSSAAAVKYPEYHFDAVRLGSALLGRIAVPNKPGLEKVGFMECEVISIKTLPAGHFVGYGEAYKTTKETKAAVVPLGVCDGYGLSKTEVAFTSGDKVNSLLRKVKRFGADQTLSCVICGKKAQVIGKVGLTDLIIDVTGIDCKVGDVAAFEFNPTLVDALVKKDFV